MTDLDMREELLRTMKTGAYGAREESRTSLSSFG